MQFNSEFDWMVDSTGTINQTSGEEMRPAIRQRTHVDVVDPGPAFMHHDVLPRLRHYQLQRGSSLAIGQNVTNQSLE